MKSGTFFLNKFGLVRSGWRAVIFLAACIVFTFGLSAAGVAILFVAGLDVDSNFALVMAMSSVASLVPAIGFGCLFGRLFEHLPFRALGCWFTSGWFKHLALGGVIGAVTLGLAVVISMAMGGLRFTLDLSNTTESIGETLLISLGVFIIAAAFEEALFRGYLLQTLNRAGYGPLAIAVTSVFFGSVHLFNPSANLFSTTNTMLAGVWFGMAYLKTRDLWFPFGIHLLWNWTQGSVFGIEVSGLTTLSPAPILNELDRGPAWLTGEHYGIEGSLACTIAILLSIALIHFLPGIKPDKELMEMTSHETQLP